MADLADGDYVEITVNREGHDRTLTGTMRRLEQDGEERWEIVGPEIIPPPPPRQFEWAVGIVPAQVTSYKKI